MKKNFIYAVALALVMSVTGVSNVWADGDGFVPFIILPPGGDDGGGDVPPLPGWGSSYNNAEFYTLTGDWINHNDIDLLNWNIDREMIYNFQVASH